MTAYQNNDLKRLYIEGVGDFPVDTPDMSVQTILNNLPERPGDVVYIESWPIIIFGLPQQRRTFSNFFIQYNPQSGTVRRIVQHRINQPVEPEQLQESELNDFFNLVRSGQLIALINATNEMKIARNKTIEILMRLPSFGFVTGTAL